MFGGDNGPSAAFSHPAKPTTQLSHGSGHGQESPSYASQWRVNDSHNTACPGPGTQCHLLRHVVERGNCVLYHLWYFAQKPPITLPLHTPHIPLPLMYPLTAGFTSRDRFLQNTAPICRLCFDCVGAGTPASGPLSAHPFASNRLGVRVFRWIFGLQARHATTMHPGGVSLVFTGGLIIGTGYTQGACLQHRAPCQQDADKIKT